IDEFGTQAVDKIVEIGTSNRAPKHDHVLVAYAIACSSSDQATRLYALTKFNQIVRIGTHLFHFLEYIKGRRGWGSSLKRAVGGWYNKNPEQLAYQLVKYRQRDG